MQTPGSLVALMDALEVFEADAVAAFPPGTSGLHAYRWRPDNVEAPYYYHWISSAPYAQLDQSRWRDSLNLTFRCGISHTATDEDMTSIEQWVDLWRDVFDPEFAKVGLPGTTILGGNTVTKAKRTGMQLMPDTFNQVSFLAVEFSFQFDLDRHPFS